MDFQVININDFYNLKDEEKEKYIKNMIKTIEESDNKIIKKMSNIVKRNVKSYRSDFYVHDLYMIKKYKSHFLWMTRPDGTDLIPLENLDESLIEWYSYTKIINKNFYFYNGKTLKKVTLEEMEKIMTKYRLKAAV